MVGKYNRMDRSQVAYIEGKDSAMIGVKESKWYICGGIEEEWVSKNCY